MLLDEMLESDLELRKLKMDEEQLNQQYNMNLRYKHHLEQYEKNLPRAEDKLASL